MASRQNGAYISQLLHTDPTSAGYVLDAVYRGLSPVRVAPRFLRLRDGLWVSADGLRTEPGPQVLRAVPGVLWLGCWPVRVLVELLEWSPSACEAAIRPSSYGWPVCTDRYARCAAGHLERLVSSLESVGGAGISRARNSAAGSIFMINGWNMTKSLENGSLARRQQRSDATTAVVEPLA